MERFKGYQFELRPNANQKRDMRRFAGCRRFVYNRALALQEHRHEQGEKRLNYAKLCSHLTEWRNSKETPWLADAPADPLQQALRDLEGAYTKFFEGLGEFPVFKKKGHAESFRYPNPKKFHLEEGNSRIFLPKLGWAHFRNSRRVGGELRNVTVSIKGLKYFISIQARREVPTPVHPSTSVVGIDMGITRFAALSDESFVPPLNSFKKHHARLKRYQRMMARRTKFGKNWDKAKAKVTRLQTHIANARRDFLHKESTTISKNHAIVCVEDLQVKNMSKSAKGTVERPGKNVKAKSGLNRAILDQGWGEFRRMLAYKLEWAGGRVIAVPPRYTSQKCPACQHVSPANRSKQARFLCVECGYSNNADTVGAINIKTAAGYAVEAWSSTSPAIGASDQELTEAACARVA